MYHNPVLLHEAVTGMAIRPNGIYVDATFGGGGHSREILKKLEQGRLIGFDQDEEAMQNIPDDDRFTFVNANFRFLKNFLRFYNALPVDGILADLGISSHQIDCPERGFSIRYDADLDFRMDRKSKKDGKQVINSYSENDLRILLKSFGEIRNAGLLAKEIVARRNDSPIDTTSKLIGLAKKFTNKANENQYMAKIFQAIRIEVNDEMEVLKSFLHQAYDVLAPGGRLVVISYHSLEDRPVKNFLKAGNFGGEIKKDFFGNPELKFRLISRKPIVPSDEEIKENNRARSAKMRIAEKI